MTRAVTYTLIGALALTLCVAGCAGPQKPPELEQPPKNMKIAPPPPDLMKKMQTPPAPNGQAPTPAPSQGR